MPLLSWLIQRGKCRYCYEKIPARYFFVELVCGIIWAGLWWQCFCVGESVGQFFAYSLGASALVAVIWIDIEFYIIPEQVNAFLSLTGLAYNVYLILVKSPNAFTWGIPSALAGWLVGVGVLWGIAFLGRIAFKKNAMGDGDIKLARGIGTILFPVLAGISIGIAVFLGAIIGLIQAVISAKNRNRVIEEGTPVSVEGKLVRLDEHEIEVTISDSTQVTLAPLKQNVVFTLPEGVECYRGQKRIAFASFAENLNNGASVAVDAHQKDGQLSALAIGRDQAVLLSLVKLGFYYLIGLDIWTLFHVPTYKKVFGEDPFEPPPDLETFDAGATMIPFGPYLAAGAIISALFAQQLVQVVQNYLNSMGV